MNDYLSNLIIRSLRMSETVQPRYASMFASPKSANRYIYENTPAWAGDELLTEESEIRINPQVSSDAEQTWIPNEQILSGPVDCEQSRAFSVSSEPLPSQYEERQATRQDANHQKNGYLTGQPGSLQTPTSAAEGLGEESANQITLSPQHGSEKVSKKDIWSLGDNAVSPEPGLLSSVMDSVVRGVQPKQHDSEKPLQLAVKMPYSASTRIRETMPAASAAETGSLPHSHPATQPLVKASWNESTPILRKNDVQIQPTAVPETQGGITAQPQVTQFIEPVAVPPAKSNAPVESPPEVHVTIGTIEVRAIPPSVPPSKKGQPKSPVMSLDEYLAKRTRGGTL